MHDAARRWGPWMALLVSAAAFGHARLVGTQPAAGAQLTESPASLTLTFNENVRLAVLKLVAAGRAVPLNVDRAAAPAQEIRIALPPLAAGTYSVEWSALTQSDGHVIKGAYSFVVR